LINISFTNIAFIDMEFSAHMPRILCGKHWLQSLNGRLQLPTNHLLKSSDNILFQNN